MPARLAATLTAVAAVACLAVFCLGAAHWLAYPYDLGPGEGNALYYTLRLLAGENPYGHDTGFPYLYNVYPPGHYLALAPLVALFGPNLLVGRLISLGSAVGLALLAARWADWDGASRVQRLVAATGMLTSATLFPYLVLVTNDVLAALLGCGVVMGCDGAARRGAGRLLPAMVVLGVLACFTRHSHPLLVVAALAGVFPVFRGRALTALFACGGTCLLLLVGLNAASDGAFLHSLLTVVSWGHQVPEKAWHLRQYVLGQWGFVLFTLFALGHRPTRRRVPLGAWLGLAVGAVLALLVLRAGAGPNYFLPLHFFLVATGIRGALALSQRGQRGALLVALALAGQLLTNALHVWPLTRVYSPEALENAVRLERYLRDVPGPALLDRQIALWLHTGHRERFVEVAGLGLAAFHGDWHPEELERFIEQRGFAVILLRSQTLLPRELIERIERRYREEARVPLWDDVYRLFRPPPGADAGSPPRPPGP